MGILLAIILPPVLVLFLVIVVVVQIKRFKRRQQAKAQFFTENKYKEGEDSTRYIECEESVNSIGPLEAIMLN